MEALRDTIGGWGSCVTRAEVGSVVWHFHSCSARYAFRNDVVAPPPLTTVGVHADGIAVC